MRKNTMIAVLITALLLMMIAPVMGLTPEEASRMNAVKYVTDGVNHLWTSNKMSSDEIYSVWVDLSQISQNTVTATVYQTDLEQMTLATYTNIKSQPIAGVNGANDKLSRFFFYLGNNNPDVIVASHGGVPDETVLGYVYGVRKTEIINAYVDGIPECLEKVRLYDYDVSSGGESADVPKAIAENPEAWAEKYLTTTFKVNETTYTSALSADENNVENTQTMDVAPYIKNDRTYVPVRYLAYSLGVTEDNVTWNNDTRQVKIAKGDTDILLTIGDPVMAINQNPTTMDVSPEITNSRTMLPARWVAEALGATVEWDDAAKQAIIKMPIKEPGN
jgi:hypothetical protein